MTFARIVYIKAIMVDITQCWESNHFKYQYQYPMEYGVALSPSAGNVLDLNSLGRIYWAHLELVGNVVTASGALISGGWSISKLSCLAAALTLS